MAAERGAGGVGHHHEGRAGEERAGAAAQMGIVGGRTIDDGDKERDVV